MLLRKRGPFESFSVSGLLGGRAGSVLAGLVEVPSDLSIVDPGNDGSATNLVLAHPRTLNV
jgi:hypothetical protein